MAGIWKPLTDSETGEHVETFSIVTTAANSLMKQVHNSKERQPTILTDDLAWDWLFGNLSEDRIKEIGQFQFPANEMEVYTLPKDFKDALDPTEPFEYPDLEPVKMIA